MKAAIKAAQKTGGQMLLKDYLEARGITAYAYAKEMGANPQNVYKWVQDGWVVVGDQLLSPKRKTKPLGGE